MNFEILVRKGLRMSVHVESVCNWAISYSEAKAIAYLFKVKKEIFRKANHIYYLDMMDKKYWVSLEYDPQA